MDFVYFDQLLKGTLVLIRCIPQGNQSTAINNFNYKRNPPESTISFAFDHLAWLSAACYFKNDYEF